MHKIIIKLILVFCLLCLNKTYGAYSISEILGGNPDPSHASYYDKISRAAYRWSLVCPIERATTYYFDATSGSDSNDGLTIGTPKQSISAMNSLTNENVAIKLKAGEIWRTTTGLQIEGSISAYGTGAAPVITAFTQTISSGGSSWTLASGNRYTTTAITSCGWIREQGEDWSKVYRNVASTAEVESTPNSWYASGGTLHINAGVGINPNNVAWEATPASMTDDISGIELVAHGARADGIVVSGQGLDTGSLDQSWGIKSIVYGDNVACISNCNCYYHARHNIGHNIGNGSGGKLLMYNCDFGWCKESAPALCVAYALSGGQEFIAISCTSSYGRLPENATRNYGVGRMFLAHTSGSGTVSGFHIVNCTIKSTSWSCDNLWRVNNTTSDGAVVADCVNVAYGCVIEQSSNGTQTLGITNHADVGGTYYIAPYTIAATEALETGIEALSGYVLGVKYTLDLTSTGGGRARVGFFNPTGSSSNMKPFVSGCHFNIIGNGTIQIPLFNRDMYNSASGIYPNCCNTLFTASNTGTGWADSGLGDAGPNNCTNCAFYGMSAGTGSGPPGYSTWTNSTVLTQSPFITPNSSPSLQYLGSTSGIILSSVNNSGKILMVPGESIGPYGRLKIDSIGPRYYNLFEN